MEKIASLFPFSGFAVLLPSKVRNESLIGMDSCMRRNDGNKPENDGKEEESNGGGGESRTHVSIHSTIVSTFIGV